MLTHLNAALKEVESALDYAMDHGGDVTAVVAARRELKLAIREIEDGSKLAALKELI